MAIGNSSPGNWQHTLCSVWDSNPGLRFQRPTCWPATLTERILFACLISRHNRHTHIIPMQGFVLKPAGDIAARARSLWYICKGCAILHIHTSVVLLFLTTGQGVYIGPYSPMVSVPTTSPRRNRTSDFGGNYRCANHYTIGLEKKVPRAGLEPASLG